MRVPPTQRSSWAPIFIVVWFAKAPFVYESMGGCVERADTGRGLQRLATLAQALALGRNLEASSSSIKYSVYKIVGGEMTLKGTYPKRVNAEGAKVRFRRRAARKDGTPLGIGGAGDDVWRELLERENWGSIDDAWVAFRKTLELGRELDVVDEQGQKIDFGADYPSELTDLEDELYD